ncbi:Meckel syndrome type 1 protein [Geodia barretti]|uniref:Meckel syndrome type 1 protein n=1 Tax=Geodia barretti TaxID=519541 RepID=A0AA35TZY4_GEOBA|nr:Meckel syndrome type 1 protein [Geodia barretti]
MFWSDPLWRRDWPIVYPHLPYSPCTSWPTLPTPWKGRNSSIVQGLFPLLPAKFQFPFTLPCGCSKLGPKNASESHSFFCGLFAEMKRNVYLIVISKCCNKCTTYSCRIDIWEEHLLCLIQVDDGGAVSVKPDFNSGQTPYRIETRNRDVYEYRLHQVMEPVPPEHIDQEKNLQEEIYRRKAEQLHNLVGTQFADPPEGGALSVVLLGEIVSAQGFEYNDIYVTAQLQLPEFWEVSGDQELSVVTQISRTKSKHLYNVANFNCPFEYDLIYHNITTIEDDLAHWPCVLMEVCSLDSWDRHRVEGYGHLPLPSSPGVHEVEVGTWRPSGTPVVDTLRRFFVGGASRLREMSYISKPSDFEGRHLSKYGFQTESSGTVDFRFNIIHQSSSSVQRFQSEQLNHAISRHGGLRTSLAATLDVFQRARQKAASVAATLNY